MKNGQTDKSLVNVDNSTLVGGTMQYALGTDATTKPDASAYTTSIPTATNAGTYYVWYKVLGDSEHLDSEPGCVKVTIRKNESTDSTSTDATGTDASSKVPYEDVPIDSGYVKDITGTAEATAESNPFETKIENNSELKSLLSLTDDEVVEGVNVWLDIQDIGSSVSETDKTLVQNASDNYTIGMYLDINLFKKVGNNDATKVTETNGKVKASIVIHESLWKSGRSFELIRVHDGEATALAGAYDESTNVFTFETDKFSTYALAYKDVTYSSGSSSSSSSSSTSYPKTVAVYRLFNAATGDHFYTSNEEERDLIIEEDTNEVWADEGVAFQTAVTSDTPVYRLFDLENGNHIYTIDATVRDAYVANGCRDEGIAWYATGTVGRKVYKLTDANTGKITYTTSLEEASILQEAGFTCEDAEFLVY